MANRVRLPNANRRGISSFAIIILIFFLVMGSLVGYVAWYQTIVVKGQLVEVRASPDCSRVFFKVKNTSSDKIYTTWYVAASIAPSSRDLLINPQAHRIEPLGPGAESVQYAFDISTHGVPKGNYQVMLRLYNGTSVIHQQEGISCTVP